jgi:hypothetical protein
MQAFVSIQKPLLIAYARTAVLASLSLRSSLEGLGGAIDIELAFGVVADLGVGGPMLLLESTVLSVNTASNLVLSFPSSLEIPISTRASRLESWLGFSRRIAFCVAARWVGDGGRGAGFIACATTRGMVEMFTDDMTGPGRTLMSNNTALYLQKNTHWCSLCQ